MQRTEFALMLILAHAVAKACYLRVLVVIATTNSQDLTEMGGLEQYQLRPAFCVGTLGWLDCCHWVFGRCSEGWIASGWNAPWLVLCCCWSDGI